MSETLDLEAIRKRCEAADPGPWQWRECGEKSNDAVLGMYFDGDGTPMPPGHVVTERYDDDKGEYEKVAFDGDTIAFMENNANYHNFDFAAHARTDIPLLLARIAALEQERGRATDRALEQAVKACINIVTDNYEMARRVTNKDKFISQGDGAKHCARWLFVQMSPEASAALSASLRAALAPPAAEREGTS